MKKIKKDFIIQTKTGSYRVIIWRDEKDNAYLVRVPSLPEVVTFGTTLSDAKRMAKDAIELFCECEFLEGNVVVDDRGRVSGKIPKSRILSPVR